jgi:prepilin-type N-terminal cleavage/methylation domain-containing protein
MQQLKRAFFRKGFTLVEMLVYIALLALLIGGTVYAAFWLLTDVNDIRAKINTDEEANFILRKIGWALSGANASAVALPAPGNSGGTLRVAKTGFADNPICVTLAAGEVRLARGAPACTDYLPLSTRNVAVAGLEFDRYIAAGGQEAIRTTFTVNDRQFELIEYLLP